MGNILERCRRMFSKTSSGVSIDSLPQELLLHVFSHLPPTELCETVSKVCTLWNDLHQDASLYKSLTFSRGEANTEVVIKILGLAKRLEQLTLVNRSDTEAILEEVSQNNTQIRTLVVKKVAGSKNAIKETVMNTLLQNCCQLQVLKLHGCWMQGEYFHSKISFQLDHLRILHVVFVITSSKALMQLVNSCVDLEEIHLTMNSDYFSGEEDMDENIRISNVEIITICNRFCKTLRSLKLSNANWTHEAFSALQKCDNLETFGAIYNIYMDPCKYGVMLNIGMMPSLRHLEIVYFTFFESTWIDLLSSPALRNLESLHLINCNLSDAVLLTIGAHLGNLRVLGLLSNDLVPTVSARGLPSVITRCSKLQGLKLRGFCGRKAKEAILLIPANLPELKFLYIFGRENVNYMRENIEKLKALMPALNIENFLDYNHFE